MQKTMPLTVSKIPVATRRCSSMDGRPQRGARPGVGPQKPSPWVALRLAIALAVSVADGGCGERHTSRPADADVNAMRSSTRDSGVAAQTDLGQGLDAAMAVVSRANGGSAAAPAAMQHGAGNGGAGGEPEAGVDASITRAAADGPITEHLPLACQLSTKTETCDKDPNAGCSAPVSFWYDKQTGQCEATCGWAPRACFLTARVASRTASRPSLMHRVRQRVAHAPPT
jgi:hypothetical protein